MCVKQSSGGPRGEKLSEADLLDKLREYLEEKGVQVIHCQDPHEHHVCLISWLRDCSQIAAADVTFVSRCQCRTLAVIMSMRQDQHACKDMQPILPLGLRPCSRQPLTPDTIEGPEYLMMNSCAGCRLLVLLSLTSLEFCISVPFVAYVKTQVTGGTPG